jgi:WD40 repeat protein/serine/threonine protein kinase
MAESSNRQKAIFLEAIDLPSLDERLAFVAHACEGDDVLRQRVEAMLKANAASDSFLERPAAALGATVDAPRGGEEARSAARPSSEGLGTRVGPYKLLELLGEGGMGAVYMAEQVETVRRMVALKIIKPGLDGGQMLARFEAERQALARMDHPNIAKVLDAGATANGRPYFVMELVKGTPITTFCDTNKLSARQRLELFVAVCQAIQHAHQKGVIHRDIKPSNVLIALYDDKPVPKVIDFGIAKAAGQPLTDRTLHTGFGAIVGTPEYMSPEQATFNQLDIDTRSDVYSLGVLLYELLTGTTPVDKTRFKEVAILEVLRVVREEEPPRPSVKLSTTAARASIAATRGTDSSKLAQLLRGELDWIVMKTLEKDRNRRYETAAGLARDVDRYLKDELVEARPPSTGYRLRKFVRRHRGAVLAAALVSLVLLAGIVGTTWGLFEARRQRDDADLARVEAKGNEAKAIAAEGHSAKSLTSSEGLRLLLQSELARSSNPSLAMLLAIEGAERHPGLLANNTLLAALDQSREERTLPGAAHTLCFSADGRRLLTANGHDVRIWDVSTGKEIVPFPKVKHAHGVWVLPGHEPGNSWIQAACFDSDGKRVLTTSAYGRVGLWDAATGKPLALLEKGLVDWTPEDEANRRSGHEYAAPARFSPDGRFVLTTYSKSRLWDAASGKEHLVLQGHEQSILWAEFSRDGQKIITASRDTTARIWDAESGKQLHVLKAHATNAVLTACFSPDGSRALTVATIHTSDGRYARGPLCRLWDVETGKEAAGLDAPSAHSYSNYSSAQFSADSSRILTYDYHTAFEKEPNWHFWDAKTGKHLGRAKSQRPYTSAAFTNDGKHVAFFGHGLDWWNAKTMELERTESVRGHHALFSPDNQRLATIGETGVHIWAISGEAERRLGHWSQFPFLALSQDGRSLATRTSDPKEVAVWDLATAREVARIKAKDLSNVGLIRFSPDGRRVIFGYYGDKVVCVADVRTGELITVLPGGQELQDADISPDNLRAVTINGEQLRIWDLGTGKELAAPKLAAGDHYSGEERKACFSPCGRWLVTAQSRQHCLRDPVTGKEVALLNPGFGGFSPAPPLFSPDGRRVLTIWNSSPEQGMVWDTETGRKLATLTAPQEVRAHLSAPAFSSDGEWIIIPCGDQTVRIWETATGKESLVVKGHESLVNAATISPDKTRIVTASADKTARLWDARTGELQAIFHGHQEPVVSARFIPEGRVLSVDKKGSARVWPIDSLPTARARAPRGLTMEERKKYEIPTAVRR